MLSHPRMAGLEEIFGQKPTLATSEFALEPAKAPVLALPAAKAKTEPAEKVILSESEMSMISLSMEAQIALCVFFFQFVH